MDSRKIQKVGERSFSVSLPKTWILKNNLTNGDIVFINENDNNNLVISLVEEKANEENKEKTANLDEIDNISEFIVLCYMKNVDKVKLTWKKQDVEKIHEVKRMVSHLEGYDIVDEDKNFINIEFLFKDVNINLNKIIRRMLHLLDFMTESLKIKDIKNLTDSESTIDRLHHLSKRIIMSCMNNSKNLKNNELEREDDLLFYKNIIKKLEGMGDVIFQLKDVKINDDEIEIISKIISHTKEILTKKSNPKKFDKEIKKSKNPEVNNNLEKINDQATDIFQDLASLYFNRNYF